MMEDWRAVASRTRGNDAVPTAGLGIVMEAEPGNR
jgi:hypothetical protein